MGTHALSELPLLKKAAISSIPRPPALRRQVALCELLDRVLNKGVVLVGEVTISVADIDLLYLGINLVVSSVETLLSHTGEGFPSTLRASGPKGILKEK